MALVLNVELWNDAAMALIPPGIRVGRWERTINLRFDAVVPNSAVMD
jgi:hypothetical protein